MPSLGSSVKGPEAEFLVLFHLNIGGIRQPLDLQPSYEATLRTKSQWIDSGSLLPISWIKPIKNSHRHTPILILNHTLWGNLSITWEAISLLLPGLQTWSRSGCFHKLDPLLNFWHCSNLLTAPAYKHRSMSCECIHSSLITHRLPQFRCQGNDLALKVTSI